MRVSELYRGRISRLQFLLAYLPCIFLWMFPLYIVFPLSLNIGIVGAVVRLALIATYCVFVWHLFVRRLHDFGFSGWFVLFNLHWLTALLLLVLCLVIPGSKTGNTHGGAPDNARPYLRMWFNK